jgi:SAM-dependent methyltransferase
MAALCAAHFTRCSRKITPTSQLPLAVLATAHARRTMLDALPLTERTAMPERRNADQIAEWNGVLGERWAAQQREIDGIVGPFGAAALQAAAARPGERVIDIGCGCGDTTFALAQAVGAQGSALGVDISQPMLAVARARAAEANLPQLAFAEADASAADLPAGCDLLFSRFGVMFFDEPAAALARLRRALRAGGRCVFVCWRAPRDNPWAMAPLAAARAALGVTPPPADPHAPGPFAFADDPRLKGLLAEAGFSAIELHRFDAPVSLGASPRLAAEAALKVGPVMRFVREVGDAHAPAITEAIERALAPLAGTDGQVRLAGSTWIVSASNPG